MIDWGSKPKDWSPNRYFLTTGQLGHITSGNKHLGVKLNFCWAVVTEWCCCPKGSKGKNNRICKEFFDEFHFQVGRHWNKDPLFQQPSQNKPSPTATQQSKPEKNHQKNLTYSQPPSHVRSTIKQPNFQQKKNSLLHGNWVMTESALDGVSWLCGKFSDIFKIWNTIWPMGLNEPESWVMNHEWLTFEYRTRYPMLKAPIIKNLK